MKDAAEIEMEYNVGRTCDPVGGLIHIPCIKRNAIGSVKTINAAHRAIHGEGTHHVLLDQAIATMRLTGRDIAANTTKPPWVVLPST